MVPNETVGEDKQTKSPCRTKTKLFKFVVSLVTELLLVSFRSANDSLKSKGLTKIRLVGSRSTLIQVLLSEKLMCQPPFPPLSN